MYDEAKKLLNEVRSIVEEIVEKLKDHPDLLYSGFLSNALAEYVEAALLVGVVTRSGIPKPDELLVPPTPYLQGLGDLVGELRRMAIEYLGQWRVEEAEELLRIMESIFRALKSLDYPEALVPGIRHRADLARRLVEDLRTMIADIRTRRELVRAISESRSKHVIADSQKRLKDLHEHKSI